MEYNVIIVRFGELSTKGKNRKDFIFKLAKSITRNLLGINKTYALDVRHDHIYINLLINSNEFDYAPLLKISGINGISLAYKKEIYDLDDIVDTSLKLIKKENGTTFKIRAKRNDKSFPYISDEINRAVASKILKNTSLKVDVHNPDILFSIEIHLEGTYFYTKTLKGMGGYPLGSTGRILMMLSGGIDSPVATYLLMKRGVEVSCIHFSSPPYTNQGVIIKLQDLLSKLNIYQPKINLYIVPFTKIQEKIYEVSKEGYPITIMRRMMYRLASKLANRLHINALATGESIGQVASQTLESLKAINDVTNLPIIRPLATYDKVDIINISKDIDTYEISIRPYEDCCTIFTNKNPKTKPKIEDCLEIEKLYDFEELLNEAIDNIELKIIEDKTTIF